MAGGNNISVVFDEFLFLKIFRTFRMAIQPTKLIITFVALAFISLSGWLMDFSKTVGVTRNINGKTTNSELQIYMTEGLTSQEKNDRIRYLRETGERSGVFKILWNSASTHFKQAVDSVYAHSIVGVVTNIREFFESLEWAIKYHFVYCVIFFIIVLAAMSAAGGSICRIAALQNAQGEKPGLTEAVRFSTKRFKSLFTAPLLPFFIIFVVGILIFIPGLLGNIPKAGDIILGLGMPLALFAGTLIAVVLIGAIAGFNLMFPAVAYDGSDSFDSISRSFSYVYARPWRMLFYTSIAAIYGSICYSFVRIVTFLALAVAHVFLWLVIWTNNSTGQENRIDAIWPKPEFRTFFGTSTVAAVTWPEKIGHFLIYICVLFIVGLVVSFIISFYFSANTIIYSLLRNKVDNTEITDIYTYYNERGNEPNVPDDSAQKQAESESES
ncbi:MAG: hypothetical protein P8016_06375 [Sedimentisphaerales bacterium]